MIKTRVCLDQFFAETYLPWIRIRKRSWELDERLERTHISPDFGHKRLSEITRSDIEKWLGGLVGRGYTPATCNRVLAVLKTMFSHAVERGAIAVSPAKDVRPLNNPGRRERFLSKSEGRELLRRLAADACPKAKIIQLLILTGARKSEIMRARWEDLDPENHVLNVPLAKSGKLRRIILSDEALAVFAAIRPDPDSPWIFPGRDKNRPLSDIYDYWRGIRHELGLGDARIHDLRHTFASVLVNLGHTLYEVQQLLGHASPQTTMRYAHLANNTLFRATNRISEAFGLCEEKGKEISLSV